MSDDEPDHELLALLAKSLVLNDHGPCIPGTGVLEDAEFIYDNSIDVAIDSSSCKAAATSIHTSMQSRSFSPSTWSLHELHPKAKDETTVDFIFVMDLLNFCFWPEAGKGSKRNGEGWKVDGQPLDGQTFGVEYKGKLRTGYWALVAVLQRALDERMPITSADFWIDENECTDDVLRQVFRSSTAAEIPLLKERIEMLRAAGRVLYEVCEFAIVAESAD